MTRSLLLVLALIALSCGSDTPTAPSGPTASFFVTSTTSVTGNLGGLTGADARCQGLAQAAGYGNRTWRAYLSVERDPVNGNQQTHAKDRIGTGPWYNVNRVLVANNGTELHNRTGDAALFLDERGQRINGQWSGSPAPVEHDILTGSNADGTLAVGRAGLPTTVLGLLFHAAEHSTRHAGQAITTALLLRSPQTSVVQ